VSHAWTRDAFDRLIEWQQVTRWATNPPTKATLESCAHNHLSNMTSKAGVTITTPATARYGFEAYTVYSTAGQCYCFAYAPHTGAWVFSGAAGVSENGTCLTSGNPPTPQMTRTAFLQTGGRMAITVTGLTVSETYRIGFVMARRGNYNAHLGRTFTVTMGGQNLGVYSPMTTTWEQALTGAVVANATSLQLVLAAGAEPGNDSMALIDDVAVMPAHPHAARAMGNGNSFEYDANGNMTVRREKLDDISYVYTQSWTIDNRLASVIKSDVTGTILATTTIGYDGDGVRAKKVDPSGTTLYLGVVEVLITGTTQVTTSYYAFGGAIVAMRTAATATLTYLHGDHLGSTSLTTNASGQKVSEQRYKPYGEVRWSSGAGMPTDFTFTGQRAGPANYVGSLMDYNARFYSPALGRFVSADSIVPSTSRSNALNRYSYVIGNPLSMRDPTGHWFETVFDLVMAAWSFAEFAEEPNLENTASLVLDVAAVVVPIPAVGGLAIKGAKRVDKIVNLVRVANRIDNVADGLRWVDRFAGASPDILNGVTRLENSLNAGKIPKFKHGLTKQLERAYDLFKQGKLKGVEVTEAANRFDFVLIGDDIVEFKYWTAGGLDTNRDRLFKQLQNYKKTGKKISLELGKTKTDPIGATELDALRKWLSDNGFEDVGLTAIDFDP
jgi:RHS repeat-associated protein